MRQEVETAWQVLRLAKKTRAIIVVSDGWFSKKKVMSGWQWRLNDYHVGSANKGYTAITFNPMDGSTPVRFTGTEAETLAKRLGLK